MNDQWNNNEPAFYAKFKSWIAKNGGTIEDRLYRRFSAGDYTRGVTINPPDKPVGTILFIHGTGNDIAYPALTLFAQLFKENIRINAFDLDGHGYQGSTLYSQAGILDFVEWALQQIPYDDPLFIVGHSFGGTLALSHIARSKCSSIQGLILISTPLKLSASITSLANECLSVFRPSFWHERAYYGTFGILPALGPFKRSKYPIRLQNQESNYVNQIDSTITFLSQSITDDSITCPLLLIYGTRDLIVKHQNALEIQNRIKKSEVFLVKGATHFTTIFEEYVPEKICSFIKKTIN